MDMEYDLAFLNNLEEAGAVTKKDLQHLAVLADCSDPYIRARAASLLVRFDEEASKAALIRLSQDDNTAVKWRMFCQKRKQMNRMIWRDVTL